MKRIVLMTTVILSLAVFYFAYVMSEVAEEAQAELVGSEEHYE